jgi:hypothetical protein
MDPKIEAAVESAYSMEREHGFVCLAAMRSDAAFVALTRLAEAKDREVLSGAPEWLKEELQAWVTGFQQTGQFGFISNLGESDHSALMKQVIHLFPPSSMQPNGAFQGRL